MFMAVLILYKFVVNRIIILQNDNMIVTSQNERAKKCAVSFAHSDAEGNRFFMLK